MNSTANVVLPTDPRICLLFPYHHATVVAQWQCVYRNCSTVAIVLHNTIPSNKTMMPPSVTPLPWMISTGFVGKGFFALYLERECFEGVPTPIKVFVHYTGGLG
ncbi:hypothetical protein AVEN_61951-1 [Araneus ventricosus]|uniref:Uncharacterized protein n=1 Tax=Araneus ventricosus TaxID=182803 RepID=A0A4Y2NAK7_ARAVE|nr:hypothetical protein AVEN_61951-1 [Araneus ventricosus]